MLDSLSCSFTSISFVTSTTYIKDPFTSEHNGDLYLICPTQLSDVPFGKGLPNKAKTKTYFFTPGFHRGQD